MTRNDVSLIQRSRGAETSAWCLNHPFGPRHEAQPIGDCEKRIAFTQFDPADSLTRLLVRTVKCVIRSGIACTRRAYIGHFCYLLRSNTLVAKIRYFVFICNSTHVSNRSAVWLTAWRAAGQAAPQSAVGNMCGVHINTKCHLIDLMRYALQTDPGSKLTNYTASREPRSFVRFSARQRRSHTL